MAEKLIHESKKSLIYFLDTSEWGKPVILKVLNYDYPTPQDIAVFYNEFDLIEGLNLPGIRNAIKKGTYNNQPAIYFEWVDAQPVSEVFKNKTGFRLEFLQAAIDIAQAVGDMHNAHIIHKDINPKNVLINLKKRFAKLIDFGISTKIDLKEHHLGNPARLEGTLAYNSPEQTGRMNRVVDYRSDLYSMGVMFYEMLSGHLPFPTADVMELVHCHLAVSPKLLSEVDPDIPVQLAEIVDLLLAKNAEDRYQSAFGVKSDLEKCLFEYETKGVITAFELRKNDFSGKFQIPQKLFGREKEIEALINAFTRCTKGKLEMLLVSGYSGTGKSAMIHEVHKPITQKRGYFIEGKFDQFQRSVPYYAFLQAFSEFVNFLLTENEEKLSRYREDIQQAVGTEGKVLTEVIPNLEHVIGIQPDVPEIGASEAQNRFNYVFGKFVNAICKPEHPIVLFIDDLQWADSASLSLLKILMSDTDNGYLLFIGAYRDNEVSDAHPFMITLHALKEAHVPVENILIGNLSPEMVNDLIAEAVGTDKENTQELTKLVYGKTQGNAFFVTQFLKSLYEEGLLQFNFEKHQWIWNLKKVEEQNITNNVVTLMAAKIQKLQPASQQVLKLAACIGFGFDLDKLSVIYEKDRVQTKRDLEPALSEGLVIPAGEQIRFSHDRIQQAVYTLIPDSEKNAVHLRIGRLLLENFTDEERDEHLFDIVTQLNHGIGLITEAKEKERLAQFNLQAGTKAKQTYAFSQAIDYLNAGISLLRPDHWQSQYDLAKNLYTQAAESSYLNSDFTGMDRHLAEVIHPDRKLLDQVAAYEIRIQALIAQNQLNDALNVGLDILNKLDVHFPAHPNDLNVISGLIGTKIKLAGKSFEKLEHLPQLKDEMDLARMRLCTEITPPAYWVEPKVLLLAVFKIVRLTVSKGASLQSIYAFGTYGMVMCELGDIPLGKKFGDLTYRLLEDPAARAISCRSRFLVQCFINHWTVPLRDSIPLFLQNYQLGLETGDLDFAALSYYFFCQHAYYAGKNLPELSKEMETAIIALDRLKQSTPNNYLKIHHQAVLHFLEPSDAPHLLAGPVYNAEEMLPVHTTANDRTALYKCHFTQMSLCYFFGKYQEAKEHADIALKLLDAVTAQHIKALFNFYDALICLALYDNAATEEKKKLLSRAKKDQKKLKKFAHHCVQNFGHKHDLVEAELLRVNGDAQNARVYYERSIEGAATYNFTQMKALGYEVAGKLCLSQHADDLAGYYLTAAYNSYGEWGSAAKQLDIEKKYYKYITRDLRPSTTTTHSTSLTNTSHIALLDFSSILKAATTISGEIVLANLLRKLMDIAIENAGAQSGILLLERDGKLFIEARSIVGSNETAIREHQEITGSDLMVESVIKYVKRTGESIVVQDAVKDTRFENDPYVQKNKIKSILALPIINQGKLIGILYLENNLTTGAFTQERIDLLSLLSGQIAVSIDNAILYDQMEQKVRDRTAELETEKKKSDDLLFNILPAETAEELKREGKTKPRKFESVTVMFTDFEDFTKHAEKLTPDELVQEVDECFSAFDEIIDKYGIEKIKTIGDSYMCVGGLSITNNNHTVDAVRAACDIQQWMQKRMEERTKNQQSFFRIRIGLHTGPVVAGVVGIRKFAFDIWGDTVNTASRMESGSEAGKVNISGSTYAFIKDDFKCTYRGKIAAKNKGDVDMYFVEEPISR